jgi:hypothetical protein
MNDFETMKCDFCGKPATKDAQVAGGGWAYVCEECFIKYCSCNTGTFTTLENIGKPNREPYSD